MPTPTINALRGHGIEVIEHPFPDHQRFIETDLEFGDDASVLMTEKDAVKCRGFAKPSWWAVPVSAELPDGFIDDQVSRLCPDAPARWRLIRITSLNAGSARR